METRMRARVCAVKCVFKCERYVKRSLYTSKETYKRDLQTRTTKQTNKRDQQKSNKKDLKKWPTKVTYKSDLHKRLTKVTYKRDLEAECLTEINEEEGEGLGDGRATSANNVSKETCIHQTRPTKETLKRDQHKRLAKETKRDLQKRPAQET